MKEEISSPGADESNVKYICQFANEESNGTKIKVYESAASDEDFEFTSGILRIVLRDLLHTDAAKAFAEKVQELKGNKPPERLIELFQNHYDGTFDKIFDWLLEHEFLRVCLWVLAEIIRQQWYEVTNNAEGFLKDVPEEWLREPRDDLN